MVISNIVYVVLSWLKRGVQGLKVFFIGLLYPSFCRNCAVFIPPALVFCENCQQKIRMIATVSLQVTSRCRVKVFAASDYQEPMKELVHRKFYGDVLASKQLARLMYQRTDIKGVPLDYIVPIPLHWTRYAQRGFNQAKIIAQELSLLLDVPMLDILSRVKRTPFQSSLPTELRKENVAHAFRLKRFVTGNGKPLLSDKRILLVDDLFTTGATITAVARFLSRARLRQVTAIVGCRAC